MRYHARFGIGLLVGLLPACGVAFLTPSAWPVALTGALLAALGFLATFFVWDADRPPSDLEPNGYEQVLFDGRNSLHAGLLVVLFVGATFGHAALFAPEASGPAPAAEAASSPALDLAQADLVALSDAFVAAHDAFAAGEDAGDLHAQTDIATALRLDIQAQEVDEALSTRQADLMDAASFLALAFEELQACLAAGEGACLGARLAHSDALKILAPDAE